MSNGSNEQGENGFSERVGRTVREIREDLTGQRDEETEPSPLAREIEREEILGQVHTDPDHDRYDGDEHDETVETIETEEIAEAGAEHAAAEEPLMLADEDERLPWLESDDGYEEGGFDMNRLVIVGLVALVGLLGLLGLIWMLSQPGTDDELLAEGSTIEAPDGPYRTAPDDPGGSEVSGTGDVSFEVGEGQSRESVLASEGASAAPSIDRTQSAAAAPAAATGASANAASAGSAPAAASGGAAVQVAAYSSSARAEQGWRDLTNRYDALQGLSHRIEEATVDGATVYRLQAVAGSVANADTICRSLRAAGGDCQVKR